MKRRTFAGRLEAAVLPLVFPLGLLIGLLSIVALMPHAQGPDPDAIQLQLRAASEQITALRYQLDRCSGEVAESRYQKAQQADSEALKALLADVQARHPEADVTLGPGGFVMTPKVRGPKE